jgi:D-lactate dehydrogenase
VADLAAILDPERVLYRPLDRLGRSVDASIYRLVPEAVVRPKDLAEVRDILAYARRNRRHLTFRAAGTSLSGQAVTDDLLVEVAPFWRGVRVLDGGRRVWVQPGVVGAHVNRLLAPLGWRLGPDPASIDAAMVGGIVNNNSSGMCCGVVQNSYHTVDSLTVLLADGTLVDTSRPDADDRLRHDRPELWAGLLALRDEVRSDVPLAERIRRKFSRKNTTGYSLNAFVDYDRPVDILSHLIVGSEGTLAFLADVTYRTVPDPPARATALVPFAELEEAGAAVFPLAEAGAAALEILDAASLRSIAAEQPHAFAVTPRTAALLAEFRTGDAESLKESVDKAEDVLARYRLLEAPRFTSDPDARAHLWKLRKGLFASTGALRPRGTSVLTEDVAVPVDRLAEAIGDFQGLFAREGVPDTVLFGHAKDGNLHFVLAEDLRSAEAVERFGAFMQGLVDIVAGKYDGAIKAEHGSGRNMAPFVRQEWGDRAYEVMCRIKALFDPDRILNPGVILNDDPRVHLKDLKPTVTISPVADACIECGFCEQRCPSRDLTLTPRQRIAVTRELVRLRGTGAPADRAWADAIAADFEYDGVATCAGDSMCQTSCPVKIDTGALVKEVRAAAQSGGARAFAELAARHFGVTARLVRAGMGVAGVVRGLPGGRGAMDALTEVCHRTAPSLVPHLASDLEIPRPAPPLPSPVNSGARTVVYFPSCLTRLIGPLPSEGAVTDPARAMADVLGWAGFGFRYPEGMTGLCCGMPFASKSFSGAAAVAASRTADALWRASREGRDPVVTDASPCAGTLQDLVLEALRAQGRSLPVYDFASFWAREVLPGLESPPRRPGTAVLHPTCTLVKSGGLPDLLKVAQAHAERATVPKSAECCGFAGDRGFLVPELTRAATRAEGAEVREVGEEAGLFSTCRTCEIGMGRAAGRPYRSIVHLVREAVRGA